LRHDIEFVVDRQRRLGIHAGAERRALQELHHDVRNVRLFRKFENRDDVAVIQFCRRTGLAVEPRPHLLRVFGEVGVHQLDGDLAVEHRIKSAVQDTHTALAHAFKDLISADLLQLLRSAHE